MKQFVKRNFTQKSGFQPLLPLAYLGVFRGNTEIVDLIATLLSSVEASLFVTPSPCGFRTYTSDATEEVQG